MPACKRRKLTDIVAVLAEIQTHLHENDYNNIRILLAAYDRIEGQISRDQKKFTTKPTLYTKTCHYIFEHLPGPLLAISKVVAILERIEKVTLESKTLPRDSLLSVTILRVKAEVAQKIIEDKNKIIQECSQLQVSIRLNSMSMILQVNPHLSGAKSDIENTLGEYIIENKHYIILRNYCLLGAMLLFTENKKTELTKILCTTRKLWHAENVYNYADLEKAETEIYRMIESERKAKSVKREHAKVQKKSIKNLEDEISILENEYKQAIEKLKTIRLEIEENEN
jgi:hypothetical protein